MKYLLFLLLISSTLANEIVSTSKVTLYKNLKPVRVSWFDGTTYSSSQECEADLPNRQQHYQSKQQAINNSLNGGETIIFSTAQCMDRLSLEYRISEAQSWNMGVR